MEFVLYTIIFALCSLVLLFNIKQYGQPLFLAYIIMGVTLKYLCNLELDPDIMSMASEGIMILLLFIVGLELDLEYLKKTWMLILSVFLLQIIIVTIAMILLTGFFDLSFPIAFSYGSNLLLSSTAIVVNVLSNMSLTKHKIGATVLSLLIVQDLSIVPISVILESLNSSMSPVMIGLRVFVAIVLLFLCILGLSYRKKPVLSLPFPEFFNKTEIMILTLITGCLIAVCGAEYLSLSASYGSFILGIILGNIYDRHIFLDPLLSMQDFLMMLFFFMIGMRISITYFITNIWGLSLLVSIVLFIKMIMHVVSFNIIGVSMKNSVLIGALLSQLSEFSFVLIEKMSAYSIIPAHTADCLISLTVFSMIIGALFPVMIYNTQKQYSHIKNNTSSHVNKH